MSRELAHNCRNMVEKADFQRYLQTTATPLVQGMLGSLLDCKPANVTRFLVRWLEEKTEDALSTAETEELHRLRREAKRLKGAVIDSGSESSGEEEVLDTVKPGKIPRKAISTATFGTANKFEEFPMRTIEKTAGQKQKLMSRLQSLFMFQGMDVKGLETVALAMEEGKVSAGEVVVSEGTEVPGLYVVDSGSLQCCKADNVLGSYGSGDYFGELALLYNRVSELSVVAKTAAKLWKLDRETFAHEVRSSAMRRQELCDKLLKNTSLLTPLTAQQRAKLIDVMRPVTPACGSLVIREGDWCSVLYIIEAGSVRVLKTLPGGQDSVLERELGPGEWFGDLQGAEMTVGVVAGEALKCLTVDRDVIQRLFGPTEAVLSLSATKP